MTVLTARWRARPAALLAAALPLGAVLALTGALAAGCGSASGQAASGGPAGVRRATPSPDPALGSFRSPRTYAAVAVPVRLRIPAAGVSARIEPRGRAPDGSAELPTRPELVGWYSGGARPGQAGPAILLGHVDWYHGPAVFFRLATLHAGDAVQVDRADRSTVAYRVTSMVRVPKDRFPSELVFKPSLTPSLRLVTCGGSFDRTTRNYRDNVIVFAALG